MISITVLAENTARGAGILGEHGLAYWIDTGTHRVLFDTGQGLALLHNAKVRDIHLANANAVVLSHGHYDHVGGLSTALELARHARLYLHPAATEPKFSGSDPAGGRRISLPFVEREGFRAEGRQVIVSSEPCEVVPGIRMTGEIPRTNDFEDTGGPFFLDQALSRPDPLRDDQALYFQAREGVVVLLGCAHAGVVNTLTWVAELTGQATIHTVMGGMHLERAGERRMRETMAALRRFNVQRLAPMHCTGWAAVAAFQREFPRECMRCAAGSILRFDPPPAAAIS